MLGVTRVLKLGKVITESPYDTEAARARGTLLHKLTAASDAGFSGHLRKVPTDLLSYLEDYQQVLSEVGPTWTGIESPVEHAAALVRGVIDRRGRMFGSRAVVDLKFGQPADWHGAQLWAYWWIGGADPNERRFAIYISPGRRPLVHEFTDHARDMRVFCGALRDARYADLEEQGAPSSLGETEESLDLD